MIMPGTAQQQTAAQDQSQAKQTAAKSLYFHSLKSGSVKQRSFNIIFGVQNEAVLTQKWVDFL